MAEEELWEKRLNDPGYQNWLKVSLALIQSKEALHKFAGDVIDAVHTDIKTRVGTGTCDGSCNTRGKGGGFGGKEPSCPNCVKWVNEIKAQKSSGQLHWKNADPKIWHKVPWEIAKCFMNPQGDKATAAAVTGPDKTDLSGMLNVLISCKEFRLNHIKEINLAKEVRKVRNKLMHCATMSFKEAEMKDMIDKIIAFLEDDKVLKVICQDTVKNIKSLKDNEFELKETDEHACIETALAAASGEDELAKDMMSKLCELIKGNKDLEMKFEDEVSKLDAKIMNMKQEYDDKFSIIDFNFGELKGRIEDLANKVASGQSFSSNVTSSVIGSEIKSYYKNMLQSYAQRKKLAMPKYESNPCENKFLGTVLFNGKKFESSEPKPTRKEAEQSAAEEALKFLGNEDSEECDDKNESPSTELQNTESTQQESKNCKGLLQEKSQKQKINKPIYNSTKTDDGLFVSEVMYNGRWFSPDMSPQNKKVDAEQKAAQYALAALDRGKKSEFLSSDIYPSQPDGASNAEATDGVKPAKNVKQFKVILNEHIQKVTKGSLPVYEVEKVDGKFICTVTAFDELYESPSSENSIQDAKESAAREACKALHLAETKAGNTTRAADLCSEKEEIPTIDRKSDETDSATPQRGSTDIATDAGSGEGKTCNAISKLNEYAQRKGVKPPVYEDIPVSDDTGGFRCKVKVLDKTFECIGSYPSKKASKQMAAMEAIKHFNRLSGDNTSATTSVTKSPAVSPPLDFKKRDEDNASPGTSTEEKNVTCEVLSNEASAEISSGIAELRLEQASGVEIAKPPNKATASENPDPQQISTPKAQLNHKNALKEYVEKRKLGMRYEKKQDPTTKMFVSKVFVGKRCFRGKDPKPKLKEAEKHVAEVALNILEGRDSTPDPNCKEMLKEYHNNIGVPTFPKYEEGSCVDDGRFNVEVKVKKKYTFVCEDAKPKKKDVEVWLAEQAVKVLEEESKMSPGEGNAKSRLNLFLQSQGGDSKYDIQGDQAKFTGALYVFVVDVYESLAPQQTKEEANAFAAMSACNGMDLL